MSCLLVYVFLLCEIILVQSHASKEERFSQDITFNGGHICREEHIIFREYFSKISCSVKCLDYSSCFGIFYDSDKKQCTGCASIPVGGTYFTNEECTGCVPSPISKSEVTQEKLKFHKLERKYFYIGCFDDCPEFLDEDYTKNDTMTIEFCINLCLSRDNMYAMAIDDSECVCTNDRAFMDVGVQLPDTDCDERCNGNSNQTCGGGHDSDGSWSRNVCLGIEIVWIRYISSFFFL